MQARESTIALALLLAGCAQGLPEAPGAPDAEGAPAATTEALDAEIAPPDYLHADHVVGQRVLLERGQLRPGDLLSEQTHHLVPAQPVLQAGLLLEGPKPRSLQWRARGLDGVWTRWAPAEITWSEDELHVGRLLLGQPATELEWRGGQGLTHATVELSGELVARPARPLTRELPVERPTPAAIEDHDDGRRTTRQAIAPASLVIPRADWGARNPDKICSSVVTPYRVSIHHTAQPSDDGPDPAARMRQMQAFHMDTRGWCDIGYHFVVSQSGNIYQGRSDERRPGAHVGGENSGNIGISLIGNYQQDQPPMTQLGAVVRLLRWVKDTYEIAWDRDHVKGHTEWPGQSTSCPGTNVLSRIDDLMAQVDGGGEQPKVDIGFQVNWVGQPPSEQLAQGSSQDVRDIFPGQTFQAEILISNRTDQPLRGVEIDYLIDQPYIRATSYTIYTDHPARDAQSWMVNDADSAPENPAKDALGEQGTLTMYAMGAGETKRVLLEMEAAEYSLGAIDHPDVRAWVRHIDGVYEGQAGWDQEPQLQRTEERLQSFAQLDVLATAEWQFDEGDADDLEGWAECEPGAHADALQINADEGALALHVTGADSCVRSPGWTELDAARFDELVLRVRAHDGPHTMGVYWAREGEELSAERAVYFQAPGDGTFAPLVIPVAEHEAWSGTITRLRLDPLEAQPPADASGWYDLDAIFFQSSAEQATNSAREDYVADARVELTAAPSPGDDDDPNDPSDPSDPGDPNPGDPQDPDTGQEGDPNDQGDDGPTTLEVNDGGCATTRPASPAGGLGALLVGLLAGLIRRRRSR